MCQASFFVAAGKKKFLKNRKKDLIYCIITTIYEVNKQKMLIKINAYKKEIELM